MSQWTEIAALPPLGELVLISLHDQTVKLARRGGSKFEVEGGGRHGRHDIAMWRAVSSPDHVEDEEVPDLVVVPWPKKKSELKGQLLRDKLGQVWKVKDQSPPGTITIDTETCSCCGRSESQTVAYRAGTELDDFEVVALPGDASEAPAD